MAKHSYTSTINHTSDAGFQAWASALHAGILAVGLVDPGDTGQADLSTASRPAVNTSVFRVYRFDDTMQGAAPVYLVLRYGTAGNANYPTLSMDIGRGTDGAGNIIGTEAVYGFTLSTEYAPNTSATYETYICCVDGAFWFCHGLGSMTALFNQCHAFCAVMRSVGASGTPTADGVAIRGKIPGNQSANNAIGRTLRYAHGGVHNTVSGSWALNTDGVTTSVADGYTQSQKHNVAWPRVRPIPWMLTVFAIERPQGAEFNSIAVGAVQRRYRSLGTGLFGTANANCSLPSTNALTWAMVWG